MEIFLSSLDYIQLFHWIVVFGHFWESKTSFEKVTGLNGQVCGGLLNVKRHSFFFEFATHFKSTSEGFSIKSFAEFGPLIIHFLAFLIESIRGDFQLFLLSQFCLILLFILRSLDLNYRWSLRFILILSVNVSNGCLSKGVLDCWFNVIICQFTVLFILRNRIVKWFVSFPVRAGVKLSRSSCFLIGNWVVKRFVCFPIRARAFVNRNQFLLLLWFLVLWLHNCCAVTGNICLWQLLLCFLWLWWLLSFRSFILFILGEGFIRFACDFLIIFLCIVLLRFFFFNTVLAFLMEPLCLLVGVV